MKKFLTKNLKSDRIQAIVKCNLMMYFQKGKKMNASQELRIFEQYSSYEEIPPAKRAWITIKAKQEEKNPVMVHAGIKATFKRKSS